MKKNVIKLSESTLRKIIAKTIKESLHGEAGSTISTNQLKEDYKNNPLYHNYYDLIDSLGNIIFTTCTKGRAFTDKTCGELCNDKTFYDLRQELLENMEGYFNSAKALLRYLSNRCQEEGEDFLYKTAATWLNKNFTPQW